jgi:hypothetical protein
MHEAIFKGILIDINTSMSAPISEFNDMSVVLVVSRLGAGVS